MMHRRASVLFALCLLLCAAACVSYTREDFVGRPGYAESTPTVAVMPFTNLTNYPKAGAIVADLFTAVLYESGSFSILSKEGQMNKAGASLSLHEINSELQALQIGKQLGVDAVIFGSVTEYRYQQGLSETPTVGFTLQMVDVASGEIVWVASHTMTRGSSLNANAQAIGGEMLCTFLHAKEATK